MWRTTGLALGATVALMGLALAPAAAADITLEASTTTADLQKALTAATPGSTVRLGAGTFSITKPLKVPANVTVTGAGTSATVLQLAAGTWSAFSYGFVIMPAGDGSTISNLTVDGNRSSNPTPPTNSGGGIKVGNGWTVSSVRLTNLNYFKVWIHQVKNVTVRDCTFDALNGTSGGEDNIGGGRSDTVLLANNTFDASTRGNAIDLLRSTNLTITGNTLTAAPGLERNMYLEAVQGATVSGNTITNGSITAKSDKSYSGTTPNTMPGRIRITGNTINGSASQGIGIVYDTDARGTVPGGGNEVSNNMVNGSGRTGVVIIHCAPNLATSADSITGNTVTNAFTKGGSSWGTGCGTVQAAGIAITAGTNTVISNNKVVETRSPALMAYGVWVGAKNSKAPLVSPIVSGNTVSGPLKVSGTQV